MDLLGGGDGILGSEDGKKGVELSILAAGGFVVGPSGWKISIRWRVLLGEKRHTSGYGHSLR